jgi:hypothetical protein
MCPTFPFCSVTAFQIAFASWLATFALQHGFGIWLSKLISIWSEFADARTFFPKQLSLVADHIIFTHIFHKFSHAFVS